jgi:hypothetical protein
LTKLNDEGLRELDRHCPQLRSLSLSFLNNVGLTTASLTQLESLALEDMPGTSIPHHSTHTRVQSLTPLVSIAVYVRAYACVLCAVLCGGCSGHG